MTVSQTVLDLACRVETFVRGTIVPFERDPRCGGHGPNEEVLRGAGHSDSVRTAGR